MEFPFAEVVAQSNNDPLRDGERLHNARRPSHAAAELHGARDFAQAACGLHAMVR